jgi:hypothetical protein
MSHRCWAHSQTFFCLRLKFKEHFSVAFFFFLVGLGFEPGASLLQRGIVLL